MWPSHTELSHRLPLPPLEQVFERVELGRVGNKCRSQKFTRGPGDADRLGGPRLNGERNSNGSYDHNHEANTEQESKLEFSI